MDLAKQRAEVAGGQAPWAIIVGCSDSRVPPELLFGGLGLGQLFVARNAGNMVDTATMGTIEYGAEHLGAPLVVVLGHESCGAVAAACDVLIKNAKLDGSMGPMVQPIVEVAKALRQVGHLRRRRGDPRECQADGEEGCREPGPVAHKKTQGRRRALRPRQRQGGVPVR